MRKMPVAPFVAGVVVGVGLSVLTFWLLQGDSPVASNTQRDVETEKSSGRAWAERLDVEGLQNFHRVSDGLYRGAKPSVEGVQRLKEVGVRTVINLEMMHSDRKEIGDTGLGYEHLYVDVFHPEDKEVVRFLQIATDPARQPAFVHCYHGSDRTGLMCAVYRVAVQGWTKEQAINEWTRGGFGYHYSFRNLVKYFRELDLDEMKRRAGLSNTTTQP